MKNSKLLTSLAVSAAFTLIAGSAHGALTGSGHDFTGKAWAASEICLPCHTPHVDAATPGAPLWNHELTTETFTAYTSGTMNADMTGWAIDGASKICLSCHDGVTALDNFGGKTTGVITMTTEYPGSAAIVGTVLTNDHPVSITYDQTLIDADGGLQPLGTASAYLDGGKVQCSSCHDVHNTAGIAGMLRESNAGSAICIKCHNK